MPKTLIIDFTDEVNERELQRLAQIVYTNCDGTGRSRPSLAGRENLSKWPSFTRHKYRGWVCNACGRHCFNTTAVRIHARRAVRGLGCAHKIYLV